LLVRGGYFGVPDFIADELFYKHPEVNGMSFGAEIRYHGEDGGRGVGSIGLSVDTASASAEGIWQADESDTPQMVSGDIDMLAFALTGYWSLFPTWYVHPYAGIGIGAAHVKGHYQDEGAITEADVWVPVLHIPIGLAIELGERLQLAIEGRFIDGIAIGGALQVRF
jgi:opacity protein-like surface antigen